MRCTICQATARGAVTGSCLRVRSSVKEIHTIQISLQIRNEAAYKAAQQHLMVANLLIGRGGYYATSTFCVIMQNFNTLEKLSTFDLVKIYSLSLSFDMELIKWKQNKIKIWKQKKQKETKYPPPSLLALKQNENWNKKEVKKNQFVYFAVIKENRPISPYFSSKCIYFSEK